MTETIVRYFGGPLDGREQALDEEKLIPGAVIKHVYLHAGPKIETHYELDYCEEKGWEYRLCGIPQPGQEVQEVRNLPLDPNQG